MELKFNAEETVSSSSQDTYVSYKKWLEENGVLVDPRVRYPTYFGEKSKGVVGVSANKPIEKGKVIIAVPYKLLITVEKVLNVKILEKIVNENPDVFGVNDSSVMKMLVLYVCYELLKGKESFYFPYFEICKENYLEKWSHWEMVALENKELMRELKREKDQVEMLFLEFLRLFMRYSEIFPEDKGNIFYQKLFERAYNFVTTRAFGWSLPSISLIPMADSLNHGNNYLNHYLIDTEEEKNPSSTYLTHKNKSNLSLLKDENLNPSENQLKELRKKKKRRFEKFIENHKKIIDSSKNIGEFDKDSKVENSERNKQYFILSEQYKSEVRNLRQLHFYETSCSEDNDTDEEELTDFTIKREEFEFDEKYKSKTKKIGDSKKSIVTKYWKLWTDNSYDDEDYDSEEEKEENKKEETKDKKEMLENYKEQKKESEGSSEVSSTSSEEDDENFDWMKPHVTSEYKNCYFVMETKNIIKENEELHNFYGRRTNKFLLLSYNFVMNNNQYDSFGFRLFADPTINLKPSAEKLIYLGNSKKSSVQKNLSNTPLTREIRLKKQRINIELINHCRCFTLQFEKKEFPIPISITLPFDREIELKTLKLYKEIIQSLKLQYMTDEEDDVELLEKTVQHEIRTAIKYRLIQKEILSSQISLIEKCIELLTKKWKSGRIEKLTWKDMKEIVKIKSYATSLERAKIQ